MKRSDLSSVDTRIALKLKRKFYRIVNKTTMLDGSVLAENSDTGKKNAVDGNADDVVGSRSDEAR